VGWLVAHSEMEQQMPFVGVEFKDVGDAVEEPVAVVGENATLQVAVPGRRDTEWAGQAVLRDSKAGGFLEHAWRSEQVETFARRPAGELSAASPNASAVRPAGNRLARQGHERIGGRDRRQVSRQMMYDSVVRASSTCGGGRT